MIKGKILNMVVVVKLLVNGCVEIENLLVFCGVLIERICVEEEKEFVFNEV